MYMYHQHVVYRGCIHDTGVSISPGLKSTYDGLATTPVCMTPT